MNLNFFYVIQAMIIKKLMLSGQKVKTQSNKYIFKNKEFKISS